MSKIEEVRGRLELELSREFVPSLAVAADLRAMLADHARLRAIAEKLERFHSLARWVSNCAGHGINSGMRAKGEELLVLIGSAKAVQPTKGEGE